MKFIIILFLFILTSCTQHTGISKSSLNLTQAEKEYIRNTNVLWSAEQDYFPFIKVGPNGPTGISVDYLNLISKKSGLRFTTISKSCMLAECINEVKTGTTQLVTSLRSTPSRSLYLRFTRPYYFTGTVIVKSTISPTLVAVGKGYAVIEYLKKANPTMKLKEFNTDEESIISLIAGQVDAVILDEISEITLRQKYNYKFDQQTIPHDYPLSFAVGKGNAVLASILDKAIAQISESEKEEISKKWKLK